MGSQHDIQEFCLKWNNHHSTLVSVLDFLLVRESLVDLVLAAEKVLLTLGQSIKVHRLVLFACSQYFTVSEKPLFYIAVTISQWLRISHISYRNCLVSRLTSMQSFSWKMLHSVIWNPWLTSCTGICSFLILLSGHKSLWSVFIRGEVNISQYQLESFLQTAEALQIKGTHLIILLNQDCYWNCEFEQVLLTSQITVNTCPVLCLKGKGLVRIMLQLIQHNNQNLKQRYLAHLGCIGPK
jgi:hypothetical protein